MKARRKRRQFTVEFKAEAVRLTRVGDRSVTQIAKDLDLTESALRQWIQHEEAQAAPPSPDAHAALRDAADPRSAERSQRRASNARGRPLRTIGRRALAIAHEPLAYALSGAREAQERLTRVAPHADILPPKSVGRDFSLLLGF
ncbi:MAG: transposase [Polyangiales bacterium]